MRKRIFKFILFTVLTTLVAVSVIGLSYVGAIYMEFLSNKNSIFEKIELFAKDLQKNKESDITLGLEEEETDEIDKKETVFLDRNGSIIAKYSKERRKLIPLREIPYFITKGFIIVEDQKFYDHFGINLVRFGIGVFNNIVTLGKAPGGSTISQQLAKILFTTHERTLKRKVYEIFCVFELEKRFTKDDLLTIYLNSIFLGHGTYGIQDASNFYFGKDAGELSIGEAALLIGMNRSPERYSPIKYPVKARNLQISTLNQLKNRGFLDKNEIDYEVSKFWTNFENRGMGSSQSFWKTEINRSGYITEYIRQTLEKSFSYDKITEGGLTVETTIDLEKQNLAENIVSEQLKYIRNKIIKTAESAKLKGYEEKDLKDLEASLVSVDFTTGEVTAIVGGSNYTFYNQFNRALYARRSIGSSVKPFIYSYALSKKKINDKEINPFTKFKDDLVEYNINGKKYAPKNYYANHKYGNYVTLYDAMKRSLNTVAVAVLNNLDIKETADFIRKASFLVDEENKKRVPEVLSLALGTCEMSALELATAYCIFPRGGVTVYPVIIKKIYDSKGNVYYDSARDNNPYFDDLHPAEFKNNERILSEEVAYEMTQMLRSVFEKGGTAYGAAFKTGLTAPVFGKSGTSQDYRDGWFAGFTDNEVTVSWVGIDGGKSLLQPSESNAAIIWCEYVKRTSRNDTDQIKIPNNMKLYKICEETGLLASKNCPVIKNFYFWIDGPIPENCYIHNEQYFPKISE